MTKTLKALALAVLVLFCTSSAFAQTVITPTTLTTAITDFLTNQVVVASVTGATANTTAAYLDGEYMPITAVNTTTKTLTVRRGQAGTGISGGPLSNTHAANTVIYIAPLQAFTTVDPGGRCVASTSGYSPTFNIRTGNIWNCVATTSGNYWEAWSPNPDQPSIPRTVVAGVAYTILQTDSLVVLSTTLTASGGVGVAVKSFTLPSHVGIPGKVITIKDESGGLTGTTNIVLVGTIDGTNSGTATVIQLKTAFQSVALYAGSGGWFTLWCSNGGTATAGLANCR